MAEYKLSIRPFRPDDLPAMQALRQAAFAPVFRSFREMVGERIYALGLAAAGTEQRRLLDDLCNASPEQVLVAAIDDEVVGFVSFTLDEATRSKRAFRSRAAGLRLTAPALSASP